MRGERIAFSIAAAQRNSSKPGYVAAWLHMANSS